MVYKENCCVPGCTNKTATRHRFPVDGDPRLPVCRDRIASPKLSLMSNEELYYKMKICSVHFSPDCFSPGTKRLNPNSLPNLFLSGPAENGSGDELAAPLSDEEEEAPKKQKLSMSFTKRAEFKLLDRPAPSPVKKGIQIRLGGQKAVQPVNTVKPQSQSVAAMFNVDDDDEPEEMPPEARMRMRNIGRETPTSAGPNSFGKTKQGFCDAKKMFEKNLKKGMDSVSKSKKPPSVSSPPSPPAQQQQQQQQQTPPDEAEAADE